MARNAPNNDAVVFHQAAMICMGVMAAAVMQAPQPMLRDLTRSHADER